MDKSIEIQHQIKMQCDTLKTDLASMKNWEKEMQEKEKNKSQTQPKDQPPIRSQLDKMEEYEKSMNYKEFNGTETATVDNKMNELKLEADLFKDQGNGFVKKQNYKEAIDMYTKSIGIYNQEASYFANRSLCYLKEKQYTECVHDCSSAIDLDEKYIKAYFRRMQAYESLGHYIVAFKDCQKVLELSSDQEKQNYHKDYDRLHNKIMEEEKKRELERIKFSRMSKTAKIVDFIDKPPKSRSKKSLRKLVVTEKQKPESIPEAIIDKLFNNNTGENLPEPESDSQLFKKNFLLKSRSVDEKLCQKALPVDEKIAKTDESLKIGENPKILDAVKSQEIASKKIESPQKSPEIPKPTKNQKKQNSKNNKKSAQVQEHSGGGDDGNQSAENSLISKTLEQFEQLRINAPDLPRTGPQFYAAWKELTEEQRFLYLKDIATEKLAIGQILGSTLDSDLLSEIIQIVHKYFMHFKIAITKLLLELGKNIEMSILAMFILNNDKKLLNEIMCHIKANEIVNDEDLAEIRNKFMM